MYARAVDDAAFRLRELHRDERNDFVLGALTLALSLVATAVRPELAVPLFIGGLALAALGVRAVVEHWEIVDRLAGERDAYVISEVRERAAREATMERRHALADHVRSWLARTGSRAGPCRGTRAGGARGRARRRRADARPGVRRRRASRLLIDPESPLLNTARPPDELRARVGQIRSGFARSGHALAR